MTFCVGPQIEKIWRLTSLFPKNYQYTLKIRFRATDEIPEEMSLHLLGDIWIQTQG